MKTFIGPYVSAGIHPFAIHITISEFDKDGNYVKQAIIKDRQESIY
jgi:hypothetical protein